MTFTQWLWLLPVLVVAGCRHSDTQRENKTLPNVIIIFADDLGYGDLGAFGHPTINTPNLDRMANEGQKWTNFYAAAPVCTPSRAGLLTGRLPVRSGMSSSKRRVLFPDSEGGLPQNEITIARALKAKGYQTAAIGKWHLGHLPEYMPMAHGFDYFFGIPYSNDMDVVKDVAHGDAFTNPKVEFFQVPLMRNAGIIERPAQQTTITKRYTEEAIKFISANQESPFFLYLAHSMPHVPLFRSEDFEDVSRRGTYGDVVEELDWGVGQVLAHLTSLGIDKNTLVVFTSDNGPWLITEQRGGSAGLLSGGKGGTFEGGMREPAIFWWPGKIKHKVVMDIGSTLDLFPTICALAGVVLPDDRPYDGYDLAPALFGDGVSPREEIFYYRDTEVFAVRKGSYKAHFKTQPEYRDPRVTVHDPPLLYDVNVDPSEKYNVAGAYPEVIADIQSMLEAHSSTVDSVENQLEKRSAAQ